MKKSKIGTLGKEKNLFKLILVETFLIIVMISLAIFFLIKQDILYERLSEAASTRYESYLLADQLRQSSDDLTRLVRSYVATGDKKFEQLFWKVLDIRDGKIERPMHYERVYWDFITDENSNSFFKRGERVALEELMRRSGFTEKEFELLAESKRRSDKLVNLEKSAMTLMKKKASDEDKKRQTENQE